MYLTSPCVSGLIIKAKGWLVNFGTENFKNKDIENLPHCWSEKWYTCNNNSSMPPNGYTLGIVKAGES